MIQDIYPHQFDNTFVPEAVIQDDDYVFYFEGDHLLLIKNKASHSLPHVKDFDNIGDEYTFLFSLNGHQCFWCKDCRPKADSSFELYEINFRYPLAQKELDWTTSVALHLRNWYEQHQFCGKCGTSTIISNKERAIKCPACNMVKYPTISPAIIVAILCEDKILLARGANWPDGRFSLVAGYVDVGETIEDAIAREAKEEVGIRIKNIRFYKSQPWPFSGSMMIGYIAEADGMQKIQVDNKEIAEAYWYDKNNLPQYPLQRSIAGEIIEKFRKNEL